MSVSCYRMLSNSGYEADEVCLAQGGFWYKQGGGEFVAIHTAWLIMSLQYHVTEQRKLT
jgi:hypothetical protein